MLVLSRKDGQWIEVTHRSGDVLRFRVYDICRRDPARVNLAFDDAERNFEIRRPERLFSAPAAPPSVEAGGNLPLDDPEADSPSFGL